MKNKHCCTNMLGKGGNGCLSPLPNQENLTNYEYDCRVHQKLKRYLLRCIGVTVVILRYHCRDQSSANEVPQIRAHRLQGHSHKKSINLQKPNETKISAQNQNKYKILCTSTAEQAKWGSYTARCATFKRWVDQCASSSVEITLGTFPPSTSIYYNATMAIKSIPPIQENLGKTLVDVVDAFRIKSLDVPKVFEIIVQNEYQSELFLEHQTHIIEHWYNSDPMDDYVYEANEKSSLKVGIICYSFSFPEIPNNLAISYTKIDEMIEGIHIEDWFLNYMALEGWTNEKKNDVLNSSDYGSGMLYYNLFRTFDVVLVTPKSKHEKLRYGSIQRITSVMKSGVPALVEAKGAAFELFVTRYGYPCVFAEEGGNYPTLAQALTDMKNVSMRQTCIEEGLFIAENFSPDYIVKKLLRALSYEGDFDC
mmetsp:Transcript_26777/g.54925  ORF Transcript_26777/g.54925 Transcript_26777/m.54925 type:complete len:422 (-) Transcript_26777:97-1362(-)